MNFRTAMHNETVRMVVLFLLVFALVIGWSEGWQWWTARQEARAAAIEAGGVDPMADWRVSGAGDGTYNGDYADTGIHNGKPYYTYGTPTRYLYWISGATVWALAPALMEEAPGYYGTGPDLPANPWSVESSPGPAPTVSEIVPPAPPPNPEPIIIGPLPKAFSEARLENVLDDDATLHMLGRAPDGLHLYTVDVTTSTWTAKATPPAALRDSQRLDTAAVGGKLYALGYEPTGIDEAFALWEYDPTGNTWTQRAAFDISAAGTTYALRLAVGADGLLYVVGDNRVPASQAPVDVWVRRIDPAGFAVTTIAGPPVDTFHEAFSLDADGSNLLHVLAANEGTRAVWNGSTWTEHEEGNLWAFSYYAYAEHSGQWAAYLPDLNRVYVLFRLGPTVVRIGPSSDEFGLTRHRPYFTIAATGLQGTLYAIYSPAGILGDEHRRLVAIPTHPAQPTVNVVVAGSNATILWNFDDDDEPDDGQGAYQVVVKDSTGNTDHDSGKTAGTASSVTVLALANDGYSAEVTVWDEDDQRSATGIRSFIVGGAPAGDNPPVVSIDDPNALDTLTGDTIITVSASDDRAVSLVRILIDGTEIAALTAPNSGADYAATWRVAGWGNGSHVITAIATDNAGQGAADTITVTLDTAGDTTDPEVTINTPAPGTIAGPTEINATCTDNIGVVSVKFYVDGQLQATLTAPNDGADYAHTWNPSGWANGAHTIRVTATDAAGNMGYDEVAITLDISKATSTRYLFSEPMPIEGVADLWRDGRAFTRALLTVLLREAVPEDPTEIYQVTAGCHIPGNSVAWADYQIIEVDHVHGLSVAGNTIRWALRAEPTLVNAYWDVAGTAAVRLVAMPSGPPLLLADTSLWRLVAGDWSEVADLSGYLAAAYDACYLDNKILVAGDEFVVADLDTGDLSWPMSLPDALSYDAIASDGALAYVGLTTAGGSKLYQFSWATTKLLSALPAAAEVLAVASGVVAVGCADGTLQRYSGGTLAEAVDTAEAAVYAVLQVEGATWLGTGAAGAVWRSVPSWTEDATLEAGDVRALAQWKGNLYAAGTSSGKVWKRSEGGWAHWLTLADYTEIRDMLAVGSQMWVAGETAAGLRVSRLETADKGDFECSAARPDMIGRIVATRPA